MRSALISLGALALALTTAGCSLAFSLDELQSGGTGAGGSGTGGSSGDGGEGASSGPGSTITTGAGGAASPYATAVIDDAPAIYLRLGEPSVEPNLGSLGGEALYDDPHAVAPSLVPGELDGSATFDDPATSLDEPGENDDGQLTLTLGTPPPNTVFDGARAFTIELLLTADEALESSELLLVDDATGGVRIFAQRRFALDGLDQIAFAMRDDAHDFTALSSYCNLDFPAEGVPELWTFVHDPAEPHPLAVYRDGTRCDDASTQATTDLVMPAMTAPLRVGRGFSGRLDELAVYPRALDDAARCAHLTAAGKPCP
jgi:hypothetical protein